VHGIYYQYTEKISRLLNVSELNGTCPRCTRSVGIDNAERHRPIWTILQWSRASPVPMGRDEDARFDRNSGEGTRHEDCSAWLYVREEQGSKWNC